MFSRRRPLARVLLALLALLALLPALAPATAHATELTKLVDPDTSARWEEVFGTGTGAVSTENAGRIWADKSVYASTEAARDAGLPVKTEVDDHSFIVGLSTLASAVSVRQEGGPAHDVVFVVSTNRLLADVTKFYEDCEFHKAYAAIDAFTVETLSATYHNILKDRLYTFAANSRERRSSQTAIHAMLSAYLKMLAPMLPFTTDEAWGYFTAGGEYAENSVLLQDWPAPRPELEFPEEAADFDALLALLDDVNQKLDELRSAKVIGQSLEAVVSISADPASPTFALLKKYAAQLAETFIVSEVVSVFPAEMFAELPS